MAYEKKDMSGVLFKNDRKERDTHPDYTGNATIDGKDYWISAWLREGAKGKFFSFAFKPKDAAPQNAGRKQASKEEPTSYDLDGDSIPF